MLLAVTIEVHGQCVHYVLFIVYDNSLVSGVVLLSVYRKFVIEMLRRLIGIFCIFMCYVKNLLTSDCTIRVFSV